MPVKLKGVFVPIVTPILEGAVDYASHERLLAHVLGHDIDGLVMFGTTGERLTLSDREAEELVERTLPHLDGRVPLYLGVGGPATAEVVKAVRGFERFPVDGYMVASPYYNRPSQDGLLAHFQRVAAATDRNILIYNIPFRTAVNVSNETLFALAEVPNVIGVKDVCGSFEQTFDLLTRRSDDFVVLAGQDPHYFTSLAYGADGGILASAHLETDRFIELTSAMREGDLLRGRRLWRELEPLISLLFEEPSPMAIKYCLWRKGLIASPECRLPLTQISPSNAMALDRWLESVSAVT